MSPNKRFLLAFFLSLWAVVLTALTGVFGAIPLRSLRQKFGFRIYSILTLAITAGLWASTFYAVAIVFFSLTILLGLFSEFEERGRGLGEAVTGAVGLSGVVLAGCFAIWAALRGPGWRNDLLQWAEGQMAQLKGLAPDVTFEVNEVVLRLPSAVLVGLFLSLFFALLLESRTTVEKLESHHRQRLVEFALPELTVWLFLTGLGFGLLNHGHSILKAIGHNALAVMLVAYFFQGLSILVFGLNKMKLSGLSRALILLVVLTQLFPLLCLIGLTDYWMNWRGRFTRHWRRLEKSKENS